MERRVHPDEAALGRRGLSLPLGAATTASRRPGRGRRRAGAERLEQARSTAAAELENAAPGRRTADRALAIAVDRLAIRTTTLTSTRVRADLGAVAPLDLRRAELDALDAALAVARALDDARTARSTAELALGRDPSDAWVAAALAAAALTEVP